MKLLAKEQALTMAIGLLSIVVICLVMVDVNQFRYENAKLKELQAKVEEMHKENAYSHIGQITKFRQSPPQQVTLAEVMQKDTNQQGIKLRDFQERGVPRDQQQQEQLKEAKVEQRINENTLAMSPQLALLLQNKKQLGGINQYQNGYGAQGAEKPVGVTSKQEGYETVTLVKPSNQKGTEENNSSSGEQGSNSKRNMQSSQSQQGIPNLGRSAEYQVKQRPSFQVAPMPLLNPVMSQARVVSHPLYEDSVVHFSPRSTTTTSSYKGKAIPSGSQVHQVAVMHSQADGTQEVLSKRETMSNTDFQPASPHSSTYSSKNGYVTAQYNRGAGQKRFGKKNDKYETMFQGKIHVNAE